MAGLASARARGREGGRPLALTRAKVRLAQASMGKRETNVRELCVELGVTKATLYRYVGPNGELRQRVINVKQNSRSDDWKSPHKD